MYNFKSTKSSVFSNRVSSDEEKEDQILQQQNDNINSLEKSLKNQDKQISEMEKLQKTGKEKENLDFKDQQKVNDFIKRQMKQDEMMKEFTKKMNGLKRIGTEGGPTKDPGWTPNWFKDPNKIVWVRDKDSKKITFQKYMGETYILYTWDKQKKGVEWAHIFKCPVRFHNGLVIEWCDVEIPRLIRLE